MALSHSVTRRPEQAASSEPVGTLSLDPETAALPSAVTVSRPSKGAKRHTEIRRRMRALAVAVRNGQSGSPEGD